MQNFLLQIMKKILLLSLLLIGTIYAKNPLELEFSTSSIKGLSQKQKVTFKRELEYQLNKKGAVKLKFMSKYKLKVYIKGSTKVLSKKIGSFLGSKQYIVKSKASYLLKFKIYDFFDKNYYSGNSRYFGRFSDGSSISYDYSIKSTKEKVVKALAERLADILNQKYAFNNTVGGFSGTKIATIKEGQTFDFDSASFVKGMSADIKYKAMFGKSDAHILEPINWTKMAIVHRDYESVNLAYAKSQILTSLDITIFDFGGFFKDGSVVVFKTKSGNYGKFKVLEFIKRGSVKRYGFTFKYRILKWEN